MRYGETVVQCGANFKIADKDSVFKQVEWLFGVNCIKRSNRTNHSPEPIYVNGVSSA